MASYETPPDDDAVTLRSEVTQVTVYSDRARVTRTAIAEVGVEPTVFAFRKLPGWVDDGSVRVAAGAARIMDVRVSRNFLARASDSAYRAAETEFKLQSRECAALQDDIAILDAQKAQIEAIKAFSLEKVTQDTTIGNVNVQTYGDVLTFIGDALRKNAADKREAEAQLDDATPRLDASRRKLDDMKGLLSLEETTVLVTLQGNASDKSKVELTYLMPGATWEPMHEIRVNTGDSNVELISFAQVTQTSGEDWNHAEVSFSLQSTVESVRLPELEALTLGDTRTTSRIVTEQISTFSRAQSAFEGQSRLWNKVHQSSKSMAKHVDFDRVYQSNIEYLQVAQSKTVALFQALKNRGTSAHFKAAAVYKVSGDGRPTRMPIGVGALKSTQHIIAVPEQSLNAALALDLTNTTGQSLLPGKAALYKDGAFIGMTDIDFIADNERFSMFLSVADHLKLTRVLDRKQSSLVHKKFNKMQVSFIVGVENLLGDKTTLTLADRIPVSEDRDIKITNVRIAPSAAPDSQGILRWELELKPKERREFRISYQVEYPPELILEAKRKRMAEEAAEREIQDMTQAAPAPRMKSSENIHDQLLELEAAF